MKFSYSEERVACHKNVKNHTPFAASQNMVSLCKLVPSLVLIFEFFRPTSSATVRQVVQFQNNSFACFCIVM